MHLIGHNIVYNSNKKGYYGLPQEFGCALIEFFG